MFICLFDGLFRLVELLFHHGVVDPELPELLNVFLGRKLRQAAGHLFGLFQELGSLFL